MYLTPLIISDRDYEVPKSPLLDFRVNEYHMSQLWHATTGEQQQIIVHLEH